MIYYFFSEDPEKHLIEIVFRISNPAGQTLRLQLPAWRPGRYQLQNFAKNILGMEATDHLGNPVKFHKYRKDGWVFKTETAETLTVRYTYYAFELNAGSSFSGSDLLYINPVNLCLYHEDRMNEPCEVSISNPGSRKIACGLPSEQQGDQLVLHATDFYHLADSPMVISDYLHTLSYDIGGIPFYFHRHGAAHYDEAKLLEDFNRFTRQQIMLFGEFPEPSYHFILIVPASPFYHGVEHRNSTMMVLGPDQPGKSEVLYHELLGLSSHELFHSWNICRIRPAELLPYDYSRENYFTTCFIAEGITTWYGDKILYDAGVFSRLQYLSELETRYKRHFEEADTASQSLTESSFDLWLDGYEKGIPGRKVSVYHKGAIAAQLLDHILRQSSDGRKSLDDVMQIMWTRFGKPFEGYTYEDYRKVCEEVYGSSLEFYFKRVIEGRDSLFEDLNQCLQTEELLLERNGPLVRLKSS